MHDSAHRPPTALAEGGPGALPALPDTRHAAFKGLLLLWWFAASFGACYFAYDLQVWVAGWPLHYWLAAQGGVLGFIAIVVVYCVAMQWLEGRQRASVAPPARGTTACPGPPAQGA